MSSKEYIKLRHVLGHTLYKHTVLVQSSTVGIYGTKSFSFHQDVLSLSVVNNSCSSAAWVLQLLCWKYIHVYTLISML